MREACLWDVVTKASADFSGSSLYWQYKAYFIDHCRTCSGTYNENCSEEAAKKAELSGPQFAEWKSCWLPYRNTDPDHRIRAAEDDLREQNAANQPWYRTLMIRVNGKQYHGLFDKARPRCSAASRQCWLLFCTLRRA